MDLSFTSFTTHKETLKISKNKKNYTKHHKVIISKKNKKSNNKEEKMENFLIPSISIGFATAVIVVFKFKNYRKQKAIKAAIAKEEYRKKVNEQLKKNTFF
jgi:hypothetical protein